MKIPEPIQEPFLAMVIGKPRHFGFFSAIVPTPASCPHSMRSEDGSLLATRIGTTGPDESGQSVHLVQGWPKIGGEGSADEFYAIPDYKPPFFPHPVFSDEFNKDKDVFSDQLPEVLLNGTFIDKKFALKSRRILGGVCDSVYHVKLDDSLQLFLIARQFRMDPVARISVFAGLRENRKPRSLTLSLSFPAGSTVFKSDRTARDVGVDGCVVLLHSTLLEAGVLLDAHFSYTPPMTDEPLDDVTIDAIQAAREGDFYGFPVEWKDDWLGRRHSSHVGSATWPIDVPRDRSRFGKKLWGPANAPHQSGTQDSFGCSLGRMLLVKPEQRPDVVREVVWTVTSWAQDPSHWLDEDGLWKCIQHPDVLITNRRYDSSRSHDPFGSFVVRKTVNDMMPVDEQHQDEHVLHMALALHDPFAEFICLSNATMDSAAKRPAVGWVNGAARGEGRPIRCLLQRAACAPKTPLMPDYPSIHEISADTAMSRAFLVVKETDTPLVPGPVRPWAVDKSGRGDPNLLPPHYAPWEEGVLVDALEFLGRLATTRPWFRDRAVAAGIDFTKVAAIALGSAQAVGAVTFKDPGTGKYLTPYRARLLEDGREPPRPLHPSGDGYFSAWPNSGWIYWSGPALRFLVNWAGEHQLSPDALEECLRAAREIESEVASGRVSPFIAEMSGFLVL